jgi:hypothetical protein
MRDFIGCGCYFLMYDLSKRYFISINKESKLCNFTLFLSGCIAGLSYWPLSYPIDVIKNKI